MEEKSATQDNSQNPVETPEQKSIAKKQNFKIKLLLFCGLIILAVLLTVSMGLYILNQKTSITSKPNSTIQSLPTITIPTAYPKPSINTSSIDLNSASDSSETAKLLINTFQERIKGSALDNLGRIVGRDNEGKILLLKGELMFYGSKTVVNFTADDLNKSFKEYLLNNGFIVDQKNTGGFDLGFIKNDIYCKDEIWSNISWAVHAYFFCGIVDRETMNLTNSIVSEAYPTNFNDKSSYYDVGKVSGDFASGSSGYAPGDFAPFFESGGGWWYAKRINGKWESIGQGNGNFQLSWCEKYQIPHDFVSLCP